MDVHVYIDGYCGTMQLKLNNFCSEGPAMEQVGWIYKSSWLQGSPCVQATYTGGGVALPPTYMKLTAAIAAKISLHLQLAVTILNVSLSTLLSLSRLA